MLYFQVKYCGVMFVLLLFELIHVVQNYCTTDHRFLGDDCGDGCVRQEIGIVSCENLQVPNIELNQDFKPSGWTNTELRISHSFIETLPEDSFSNLRNISVLMMEDAGLRSIQPDALIKHRHLKEIYLNGNSMVSIADGTFELRLHLDVVDLSRNRIENISDKAFAHLGLKKLNLSRNALSELGCFLMWFRDEVNIIDVSFNNITVYKDCTPSPYPKDEINYCISENDRLNTELYLRNNKIRSMSPLRRNIVVLDLGNNMLSNPSIELFNHTLCLKRLYLDGNGISTIPNSLFRTLTRLTVLDLSNNYLSSFSYGTFDALTQLQTLDVSRNKLRSLPGAFHSLASLNNLYLQQNDLQDLNLDSQFRGMFSIKAIGLNGNRWNCQKLTIITTELRRRNVSIIRGFHSEDANVFGISCREDSNENSYNSSNIFSIPFLILMIANVLLMSVLVCIVAFRLKFVRSMRYNQVPSIIEERS